MLSWAAVMFAWNARSGISIETVTIVTTSYDDGQTSFLKLLLAESDYVVSGMQTMDFNVTTLPAVPPNRLAQAV